MGESEKPNVTIEKKATTKTTFTKKQAQEMAAEAVKAAMAERDKQEEEKMAAQAAQMEELKKQVAALIAAQNTVSAPVPSIIQTGVPMVTLWFQDAVNPNNVVQFGVNGKFGTITGPFGMVTVSKNDFMGEFRDTVVMRMLARRTLIVLDGLSDVERKTYGVDYKDGETLSKEAFAMLLDLGEDELLEMFPKLCLSHREMVARRMTDAAESGDKRVTKSLLVKLNKISKEDYAENGTEVQKRGAFAHALEIVTKRIDED